MAKPTVAIVGATGVVGQEVLKVLAERDFPLADLKLLASGRIPGRSLRFRGEEISVEEAVASAFNGVDIVFCAAGTSVSEELVPKAVEAGAVVVDKSSAFRYRDDVPLVVPEVNGADVSWHKGIIASPNCSTIQMVVALAPLHKAHPIRRVVVSTYQSVSGAGAEAMAELEAQSRAVLAGTNPTVTYLPRQIAFNVVPEVETFRQEDGYTTEEWKLATETRKIMHAPDMRIAATCVRVPVYRAHSEAVTVEFDDHVSVEEATEILKAAPGVKVIEGIGKGMYPTALDADGNDDVWVGRIRQDVSSPNGLVMWVVSDNLRKGAATNAVQIAEALSL